MTRTRFVTLHSKAVIQRVIDNQVEYAIDWAYWDDTYALLTTDNHDYAQRNLSDETLLALSLDMMGFTDLSGEVIDAKVLEDVGDKH
jgi:Predicted periplasmic ligand-binding sensor domain